MLRRWSVLVASVAILCGACAGVTASPTTAAPGDQACARQSLLNDSGVTIHRIIAEQRCHSKSKLEDGVPVAARDHTLPDHPCITASLDTNQVAQVRCVADWVDFAMYLQEHQDCIEKADNAVVSQEAVVPPELASLCRSSWFGLRDTTLWRDITQPWKIVKGWALFVLIAAGAGWLWTSLFGRERSSSTGRDDGPESDDPYLPPEPDGRHWERN